MDGFDAAAVTRSLQAAAVMDRIKGVFAKLTRQCVENIADDADVGRDLGLDSLDKIEAGMMLEDEFGIELKDEEIDDACMGTISGIFDRIGAKLSKA